MTPKDLLIFDSTAAADGIWYKIDNVSALSIHILNLEASCDTWIEVSNNPLCDYLLYGAASTAVVGVAMTGNLGTGGSPSPPSSMDEQDISYSLDGTQCMWSPSCLVWKYVRVRKSSTGTPIDETKAYLFGQVNT
jgi:hypothetical protein